MVNFKEKNFESLQEYQIIKSNFYNLKIYLNDFTNKNYKLDKIVNFELLFYSCDIQNIQRKR